MSDYHSNEYYHILEIPGKGFGAIAKKDIKIGTLILKEKSQIQVNGNLMGIDRGIQSLREWLEKGIPDWIKSVMASYDKMTKVDQDEFLKLDKLREGHKMTPNDVVVKAVIREKFQGAEYDQAKILSIVEIFCSNSQFEGGEETGPPMNYIEIRSSKFNDSCINPNSKVSTECEYVLVRATRNIKAGEEITIRKTVVDYSHWLHWIFEQKHVNQRNFWTNVKPVHLNL